jgi:hypothetical protein
MTTLYFIIHVPLFASAIGFGFWRGRRSRDHEIAILNIQLWAERKRKSP